MHRWGEQYLYSPTLFQKIISLILLPLSWLYCGVMYLRYLRMKPLEFSIPVVSVGNLTVGGSGKTPLVTALARDYKRPAILLRGYGRQSKGVVIVSDAGDIQCDVTQSGDEAMIYAHKLSHAVVIVSECRECVIGLVEQMGCDVLFLDDGYSKHRIRKLDLLIDVQTTNSACLPSGPYRERLWSGKEAVMLREGEAFKRLIELKDPASKMVLVTAIARPERLDPYLPEVVGKYYFNDHYFFTRAELEAILEKSGAESLLVTYKDYVKMADFGLPISLLDLDLELSETLIETVEKYVKGNR